MDKYNKIYLTYNKDVDISVLHNLATKINTKAKEFNLDQYIRFQIDTFNNELNIIMVSEFDTEKHIDGATNIKLHTVHKNDKIDYMIRTSNFMDFVLKTEAATIVIVLQNLFTYVLQHNLIGE